MTVPAVTGPDPDEEPTLVVCRACGERVPTGLLEECPKCKAGLLASQRRTTRLAMALELVRLGRDLCVKLEAAGTTLGDVLAARGRVMVEGFLTWPSDLPDQGERARQIQAVADWQRQAEEHVARVRVAKREGEGR